MGDVAHRAGGKVVEDSDLVALREGRYGNVPLEVISGKKVVDVARHYSTDRLRPIYTAFEGKPLFPERKAYTVTYPLSPDEALLYASRHHRDQLRKGSRVPYMTHLMSVSALVLEHGGSARTVAGVSYCVFRVSRVRSRERSRDRFAGGGPVQGS